MDIQRRIRDARNLTPTEQQLASTLVQLGERMQDYTIKEFALAASASIPSVHRFCKKLGLEGFKELKVELARASARSAQRPGDVDIDFPFSAHDDAATIAKRISQVYELTLNDTRALLDASALDAAARLIAEADAVDIYTQSHNLHPAQMFCDRLLSAGKAVTCHESIERQVRTALAAGPGHVAVAISYSGLGPNLKQLLPILKRAGTPVIFIATPRGAQLNPGLAVYLTVSDRESLQNRITQFASHIAVQYVLDTLYASFFALDYERSLTFLKRSVPHTSLPALRTQSMSPEAYVNQMLEQLK